MAKKEFDWWILLIPFGLTFFLLGPEGLALLSVHSNQLNSVYYPNTSNPIQHQIAYSVGSSGPVLIDLCSNLNSYIVQYGVDYECNLIGNWTCNNNEVSCTNIKIAIDCNSSQFQSLINFCNNNGGYGTCDSSLVSCKV